MSPHMRTRLDVDWSTLPARMAALAVYRGYPVPWFVAWLPNGEPEFRAMDGGKFIDAIRHKLCWVCGHRLGTYLTFVLGPMCVITGTASEPPAHRECATWSARNCPFLSKPHMRRREDNMPAEALPAAGHGLERNPGVTMLWITRSYKPFEVPGQKGRYLIRFGPAEEVEFYAEGRFARRAEIEESVRTVLPLVLPEAEKDGPEAVAELRRRQADLEKLYAEWPA